MKFDPQSGISDQQQRRIDAALRSAGSATPAPGLEGRILSRLAAARIANQPSGLSARLLVPAMGFAAGGLVCAMVIFGSVEHSREIRPGHAPAPPVLVLPGQGMGAASAVHAAAPSSAPLAAGPDNHGRSTHRLSHARAHIAPNARKAHGVVVPAPPAVQQP